MRLYDSIGHEIIHPTTKNKRIKGDALETLIVEVLSSHSIKCRKQPLSGQLKDHKHDIYVEDFDMYWEAKNHELWSNKLWDYQHDCDALVIRKNHREPLLVMPLETFARLFAT